MYMRFLLMKRMLKAIFTKQEEKSLSMSLSSSYLYSTCLGEAELN